MKAYVYRVEIEEEDGIWSAVVPALPGCAVDAGSFGEALYHLREATEAYLEVLIEAGRPVPQDQASSGSFGAAISVNV